MLNFTWIARMSTSRYPLLKGLLPSLGTLATLLILSLTIATGAWLWAGAAATLSAFVPYFLQSIVGISTAAIINFWFNRDIMTAALNTREVREGFKFDERNPTDLRQLVNHVRCELNAHFREKHGNAHVDLPMPRLCLYTSNVPKIQAAFGRTHENAALFFSDAFFNSHDTRWNQRHLAALVSLQLTQAYYARGWSATFVGIGTNFLNTFRALQESSHWYFRVLGWLAGPLQFFFYVQKAIERSYRYEASTTVVATGRGMDFHDAIDIKVCPSLCKQPPYSVLLLDQERKRRDRYNGPLAGMLRSVTDRIDGLELIEDANDKRGYRLLSAIDIMVRESLYSLQELASDEPRTTRLKDHLRPLLGIGGIFARIPRNQETNRVNFDNMTVRQFFEIVNTGIPASVAAMDPAIFDMQMNALPRETFDRIFKAACKQELINCANADRARNELLFAQIEEANRYAPISPGATGLAPSRDKQRRALESKMDELSKQFAAANQENHDPIDENAPQLIITSGEKSTPDSQPARQSARVRTQGKKPR